MQNALRKLSSPIRKINQYDSGNVIAQQGIGEKIKPFVSLKIFTADVGKNASQCVPASGQAMITYIIAGEAIYADSTGKSGALQKDDWSWVITGSGAWCAIEPLSNDYLAIQLSIALTPALENSLPQSAYCDSRLRVKDGPAQVLIGWHADNNGEFAIPALINYLVVHLTARQDWIYELPVNHHFVWIYVVSGVVATTEGEIRANRIVVIQQRGTKIMISATHDAIFVVGSTQQFMHDLIFHNNSVHTSQEALRVGVQGVTQAQTSMFKE